MENVFPLIQEQQELLEDRAWSLALKYHGIERTKESVERISLAMDDFLRNANAGDVPPHHSVSERDFAPVDSGLVAIFLNLGMFHRISDPREALETLATISWGLGAMEVFGRIKNGMPVNGSINLAKLHASAMARLSHAEDYALVEEAVKYWREKIDPGMSAAKAANELVSIVPLSHKKLAAVVSKEKKKRQH
jgi:hypothetical protein